jgi:phosphatidylserine decarboxylase
MITRYGYDVVSVVLVVTISGVLLSWYFIELKPLKGIIIGFLLLLLVFTVNFFRDPDRKTPSGDALVIAPADGRVVLIQDVEEPEYLQGPATQISIFMSPLNVHVNRFPVSGRVGYFKHIPGEFMVAFDEKSSHRNERTHIGVEQGTRKVFFKQIAGFVARRIVAQVNVGDEVIAGERFGMIKFGSRVDVLVPRGASIEVGLGEKTAAGETVLARMNQQERP